MPVNPAIVSQLQELLTKIRAFPDPRRASTEWKQVFTLLKRTPADANHVANTVASRDVARLSAQIAELGHEPAPAAEVDDATCQSALRAFKKRLKLIRLDDESSIARRDHLSAGNSSGVDAIAPPTGFSADVWAALVKQGHLRTTGGGLLALMKE